MLLLDHEIPPGLTCVRCERRMTGSARRTPSGYEHAGTCPRLCGIEGCERRHLSGGYCAVHYQLQQRHGHPLGKPAMELEDIEWMAQTGETLEGAAQRLQCHPKSIERFLERNGRHDISRRLRAGARWTA